MDEIKRLGRFAFERAWLVTEESLDRAWEALLPLIEQMFARLEALTTLLRLVAFVLAHFWMEIFLQPAFDDLGKEISVDLSRLVLICFLLLVAGGLLFTALVTVVAVIIDRRIRRRAASRPES